MGLPPQHGHVEPSPRLYSPVLIGAGPFAAVLAELLRSGLPAPSATIRTSSCIIYFWLAPAVDLPMLTAAVLAELLRGKLPAPSAAAVAARVTDARLAAWLHEPHLVQVGLMM